MYSYLDRTMIINAYTDRAFENCIYSIHQIHIYLYVYMFENHALIISSHTRTRACVLARMLTDSRSSHPPHKTYRLTRKQHQCTVATSGGHTHTNTQKHSTTRLRAYVYIIATMMMILLTQSQSITFGNDVLEPAQQQQRQQKQTR